MSDPHQNDYLSKPIGDAPRVRKEAAASATEIRQFINGLRGKSPQEMLGAIAQSSLIQATIQATVWTTVFLAIFTVGPYVMKSDAKAASKAAPAKAAKKAESEAPAAKSEKSEAAATAAKSNGDEPSADNVQKAAKAMGLDEVKNTDPKKNPREKDLDTLLDDLK